ncbi:site-specific integrase [Bradyrhizobium sp. JR4.1]|uniref:site-specific integrase n=1 Tax=Bradyrhizobium sp. JR4.1 TaxID=3156372 RepID=UPI0033940F62
MGVIKDRHGTYCARKTVPEGLQAAVARELNNGKPVQKHLKKSLGTKDPREANIRAKPVLAEFDRIIAKAKANLAATTVPIAKRTSLNDTEIKRMAEWVYATALKEDEALRFSGRLETIGPNGENVNEDALGDILRDCQQQFAVGDVSFAEQRAQNALASFGITLDQSGLAYHKLCIESAKAFLTALDDIGHRYAGAVIETPRLPDSKALDSHREGGTLQDALAGWKKHRVMPKGTVNETSRAVDMFIQLHGNMAVAAIKKRHALEYRSALQDAPRHRTGSLRGATLPEQAAWGREHPEVPRITAATINKQLGGVQAICVWASDNGLIPDNVQWVDPFSRLRLPTERSERTSFEIAELQSLFNAPLFTEHRFPVGAHGAAGFWLPVLALYTGARQAELGHLTADNVKVDAQTGVALLYFVTEKARGKRTKTDASERTVPVHPEAIRLGFLDYVEGRRSADSADAWLFPSLSPDRGTAGVPAWSKWFGRYLRDEGGVTDKAKVFHSFRHTVKDALRRGGADHEIREDLIGHAQASTVSGGYGANAMLSRWGAEALSDAIKRISYPGLDLSRVKPLGAPPRTRDNTKATKGHRTHTGAQG